MVQIVARNQKSGVVVFYLFFNNVFKANLRTGIQIGKRLIQYYTIGVSKKSGYQSNFFLIAFGKVSNVFFLAQNLIIEKNLELLKPAVHLRFIDSS